MYFSVIIPTYKREKDLKECIISAIKQDILPKEILVIDDGDLGQDFLKEIELIIKEKNISFVYYKKDKRFKGSAESKSIGIKKAKNDIVFILDDDLILESNFFSGIIETWENNYDEKLIGVGAIITNNRKKSKAERFYNKLFSLTSKYSWDINDVGFQVWDEGIAKQEKGHYAHGGVCSYKRDLALQIGGFTTFGGGRTALEDVEFCLRAKKQGYHFIINPKAKVIHKQSRTSREKDFLIGFKEGYNRKIIFNNNCKKNLKNYLWFCWASFGWILRQFLVGHFMKGLGMIAGYFNFMTPNYN